MVLHWFNATGGMPTYVFSWSHDGGITGPIASNLSPGAYEVIVTDQNTCRRYGYVDHW